MNIQIGSIFPLKSPEMAYNYVQSGMPVHPLFNSFWSAIVISVLFS